MSARPNAHLTRSTIALVTGGVAIGTAEFVAMGLLPEMAAGVGVDIPSGGLAISAYAVGVVVGAPTLSALGAGRSHRGLLLAFMAWFLLANIATVTAVNLPMLLAARFAAGLPHGAFFGLAAVVAVELAGSGRGAVAVSRVMLGIPIANIVGVPLATWLGQETGWRSAYMLVSILALATVAMIWSMVPRTEPSGGSMRNELGALRRPALWLAMAIGAIGFAGQFSMYSYVKPLLLEVSGARTGHVPIVLFGFGIGALIGTWMAGAIASRSVWATIFIGLGAMAASYTMLAFLAPHVVAAGLLVSLSSMFASFLVVGLQLRLMEAAGEARVLGASLNHAALNFANALGAWVGGQTLAWGWGWLAPTWMGIGLSSAGLLIAVIAWAAARPARTA